VLTARRRKELPNSATELSEQPGHGSRLGLAATRVEARAQRGRTIAVVSAEYSLSSPSARSAGRSGCRRVDGRPPTGSMTAPRRSSSSIARSAQSGSSASSYCKALSAGPAAGDGYTVE
jgi:hypothetical protein